MNKQMENANKICEGCGDRLGRWYHHPKCDDCRIIDANDFNSAEGILLYLSKEIDILQEDYDNSHSDGSDPDRCYQLEGSLSATNRLYRYIKKARE